MADDPNTAQTDPPATGDQTGGDPVETAPEPTLSAEELKAELETWKSHARKHEDRAKANAKAAQELDALKKSSMSETDQKVREAVDAALSEAQRSFGSRLVDAEVRAAAAGRDTDVEALLEGLDRSRFLNEDAEPDTGSIKKWLDKIAPKKKVPADLGQGNRGSAGPKGKADVLGDFFETNFPV